MEGKARKKKQEREGCDSNGGLGGVVQQIQETRDKRERGRERQGRRRKHVVATVPWRSVRAWTGTES